MCELLAAASAGVLLDLQVDSVKVPLSYHVLVFPGEVSSAEMASYHCIYRRSII